MRFIFRISLLIYFVLLIVCIRSSSSLMASSSLFHKVDNYDDETEKMKTYSNESVDGYDSSMGRSKLITIFNC